MIAHRSLAAALALAFATAAVGMASAQVAGMPPPAIPKAPASGEQAMKDAKTPPGLRGAKQLVFVWNPDASACGGLARKVGEKAPDWLSPDHKKAAEEIYARRADLNAFCLFDGAALMSTVDIERAGLLYNMARLRARFDAMRCKSRPKAYPALIVARENAPPPPLLAKSKSDKSANKRWAQKALAEPKLFQESSSVEKACADGGGPGAKANWAVAEKDLRASWAKAQ